MATAVAVCAARSSCASDSRASLDLHQLGPGSPRAGPLSQSPAPGLTCHTHREEARKSRSLSALGASHPHTARLAAPFYKVGSSHEEWLQGRDWNQGANSQLSAPHGAQPAEPVGRGLPGATLPL